MAKKPGVTTIASGYYSRAALNANFEALNNAFDNTVSRDGSTPNSMSENLDLNGNEIINGIGKFNNLYLNNALVSNLSTAFSFRSAWVGSTSYNLYDVVAESGNSYIALVAHTSGSNFSSDLAAGKWFILAAKGTSGSGSGDMLGSNNLSDLASAPAALGNLGISSTAAELNYTDGVSSNIQTQLNARNAQAASAWTTGTSTTEGIVSPAKVKSAIETLASAPSGSLAPVSPSGTSAVDFTSIPADVRQVTIMLDQLSMSGSDDLLIQIGDSGGIETSGYISRSVWTNASESTAGMIIRGQNSADKWTGSMTFTRVHTTNTFIQSHTVIDPDQNEQRVGAGSKTLSGELTQLKVKPSGSNTFDGGSVSITWSY